LSNPARITLRGADRSHAAKLHALIVAHREEGRLLPRTLEEVTAHAERFVIAFKGRRMIGCAELAPLSPGVAEVRSLVVDPAARGAGAGTMLVDALRQRGRREGFDRLCAFTHRPAYFIHLGFSIVPHLWLTEKIFTDCVNCPLFRRCGQYAMVVSLDDARDRPAESPFLPADAASARHA
jgi:amino-acid N-acetyltransferase